MRDRLLIRHFLWRFLDHDLISPSADRHVVLSAVGETLVAISLFLATLTAISYQFSNFMPPGITSLRSLDDRFLFTSASMLVMALVAVAQWDALVLDARDTTVLGLLPIPTTVIVRAKFVATGLFAAAVVLAWNLFPMVFRAASLPLKLPIGLAGVLRLTLAQGIVTIAAGLFGFLAVLGLREVMVALLGPDQFHRISAAVQAALVVVFVTASLLLLGTQGSVARDRLALGGLTATMLPPLWFVGLHETLAGSVIDGLPRTRPAPYLVVAERNATDLYRRLWPVYHELALIGMVAFVLVCVITTAACLWNSRRLPVPVIRRAHADGVAGRAWNGMLARALASTSLRQAGFGFTLQILSRQVSQRVALAVSFAVGLSLTLVAARGRVWAGGSDVASVPLAILAGQSLLLGSLLSGFRHAVRIPADLRASSTFSLAWTGDLTPYLSGVKLAGWVALVVPTLGGLFIWHVLVLDLRLAVLHLGTGLVVSALLIETLFVRYRLVPFASGYVPSGDVRSRGVASVAALLSVSFTLAWVERFALTTTAGYLALVVTMVALSAGMIAFDRASRRPRGSLILDEQPPPLPTQRLGLAG